MALTTEQQSQLEFTTALEAPRNEFQLNIQNTQIKLDTIRMAKDILVENMRNAPVGEREITATAITTLATALETHIKA